MVNADLERIGFIPKIQPLASSDHLRNSIILITCLIAVGVICLFSSCGGVTPARAEEYSNDQIANAIYRAEGGAKTRHPYGILTKYKTTTPRQACINTINHARRDFKGGDFISFLGARYCPIGAKNDPTGLNKNWVKNVNYWLARSI